VCDAFVELLPGLQALPRRDKLRVVQFLAGELVCEEASFPFAANPIWSPSAAFEAAAVLQDMPEQGQQC
jgi:hypothetical protein